MTSIFYSSHIYQERGIDIPDAGANNHTSFPIIQQPKHSTNHEGEDSTTYHSHIRYRYNRNYYPLLN